MGILEDYNKLKVKSIRLRTQVKQHYDTAKDLKQQYDEMVFKLEAEVSSINVQETSIDMLKEIVDRLSQDHIERIVDLLSYALSVIFYDKDYTVEVEMGDKRNAKTAEFVLVERNEEGVTRSSFDDEIGGGIIAVVGIVLQVYYIGMLNLSPIIFVDEGFTQISSSYIDNFLKFIKELAEQKKFIVVLVSHDERLIAFADRTYRVDSGEVRRVADGRES